MLLIFKFWSLDCRNHHGHDQTIMWRRETNSNKQVKT